MALKCHKKDTCLQNWLLVYYLTLQSTGAKDRISFEIVPRAE